MNALPFNHGHVTSERMGELTDWLLALLAELRAEGVVVLIESGEMTVNAALEGGNRDIACTLVYDPAERAWDRNHRAREVRAAIRKPGGAGA